MEKKRVWEVDALRGICILLVIFDHMMLAVWHKDIFGGQFTSKFMEGVTAFAVKYWNSGLRRSTHYFFVALLILLSGISTSFSRNNLKKSLKVLFFALLVTWIFVLSGTAGFGIGNINFGILHFLGVCGLIYAGLEWLNGKIVSRKPWWVFPVVLAVLGAALLIAGIGYVSNPLAAGDGFGVLKAVFVHTTDKFSSADYWPLLPWAGFFLLGSALGKCVYRQKRSLIPINDKWVAPLTYAGRNSLWFYLAGQAVPVVLMMLGISLGVL